MYIKDYLSQSSQVYFLPAFTNLQNITTSYKLVYKIYIYTLFDKVIKNAKPGGFV